MFHCLQAAGFDVRTQNHARAILAGDFAEEIEGLISALLSFRISAREVVRSGGGQAASTMRLRDALYAAGWRKHEFVIRTTVDGTEREATSHEVDHVKSCPQGTLALEIEDAWSAVAQAAHDLRQLVLEPPGELGVELAKMVAGIGDESPQDEARGLTSGRVVPLHDPGPDIAQGGPL